MKKYFYLLLFAMGCFVLGNYNQSAEPIKNHQWALTSLFTVMFLLRGLKETEKEAIDDHYKEKWRRIEDAENDTFNID